MKPDPVVRDERTIGVENAGYRLAYLVLPFGLLAVVALRSWRHGEQPWDLVGLVLFGGIVSILIQARQRVLSRRWLFVMAVTLLVALLVGWALVSARGAIPGPVPSETSP